MGKEVLTGWIDETAKRGWEEAAALLPSQSRKGSASFAELLEKLGLSLSESAADLKERYPDGVPECRLTVSLSTAKMDERMYGTPLNEGRAQLLMNVALKDDNADEAALREQVIRETGITERTYARLRDHYAECGYPIKAGEAA